MGRRQEVITNMLNLPALGRRQVVITYPVRLPHVGHGLHLRALYDHRALYRHIGSISASPSEAVIVSTGTPIPAQWTCRRRCRYRVVDYQAGFHTWDMADIYGPAEQYYGHFREQLTKQGTRARTHAHTRPRMHARALEGIDASQMIGLY